VTPKTQTATGTQLRQAVAEQVLDCAEFRAGVIYANTVQNFPTSFQAIDAVIRHSTQPKVIVGRKTGEKGWRFPGGFVDPGDPSLERAVKREVREEVGDIEIDDIKYVCSIRVDDYRYRKSQRKIMTALFEVIYIYGPIKAGDDLEEIRWQDIEGLTDCLVEEHKPLAEAFIQKYNKH
jgi:NADH pyrophosphatase NudC (nudix superfamily)